ncbi:SH3 domain-containing protein [Roseibium aggregatum]|uniref:SH3 domain-containing protein n=1 Tax=Roseibium aggregatum TaxID=187304 RepID=A0A926NXN5_9HYPH|nr:SH3 domain-containing protein [Roseibium aggregatum]MBD1545143.1 SH3 domain-containing protein [Roseibium aggregatum]
MRKTGFRSAALIACTVAMVLSLPGPAAATSGPGCLVVVNVAANDALNMRSRPSASSSIVDTLVPGRHGIIHLDAPCEPPSRPWPSRWCPVSHYNGDFVSHGWVKARYVRDSDCP